jgi:hypothetical protein
VLKTDLQGIYKSMRDTLTEIKHFSNSRACRLQSGHAIPNSPGVNKQ